MSVFLVIFNKDSTISAASLSEIRQRGYIKMVTNATWPPFESKNGNDIVGIDIDICREIAKRLGVELRIEDVAFDAIPLELFTGNSDVAASAMSCSEEKAKSVDFSVPYFTSEQRVIVAIDGKISEIGGLKDAKIGVQLGSSGDNFCTNNFRSENIVRYVEPIDAILDLKNSRLDAVVVDQFPADKFCAQNTGTLTLLDDSLYVEEYRLAVSKNNSELLLEVNGILSELQKSGRLQEIVKVNSLQKKRVQDSFLDKLYDNLIDKERYKLIFKGLLTTLEVTVVALVLGVFIGSVIACIKLASSENFFIKILKWFANIYLAVFRGTPLVVQLFVMYYAIFAQTRLGKLPVAMIAFGINSGAYVAEIIRGGILSIDRGQYEAGRSLGLSNGVTMLEIILPQALKNIISTLCNEFISLVKETSIVGWIGVVDLTRAGDIIKSQTFNAFIPLATVALVYLIVVYFITFCMSFLEKRLRAHDKS